MSIVWVNIDIYIYMAFKQIQFFFIVFSFFLDFAIIKKKSVNLVHTKIGFSSVLFNIQKSSVSSFGSVDRL